MTDPNFMVIGVPKAGTTWLWTVLKQHPDIYVSTEKEINFFNNKLNYSKGIEWYRHHFSSCTHEYAIGEFTPNYLRVIDNKEESELNNSTINIPSLIYKQYPNIKLIVSLRDPVKRAVSAYYHHIGSGFLSPFQKFSEVSHIRGITSTGFYYSHLCKWLKYFNKDQIMILIYEEDILQDKENTLLRILQFLNVDEFFEPKRIDRRVNTRKNTLSLFVTYYTKSQTLGNIVAKSPLLRSIDYPKITISQEEMSMLVRLYAEENRKLQELLGRNLSVWKHEY